MAKIVEPLILQNINRDVSPNALDYSGRRVINPVRDVLNGRYLSSEGEQTGMVENIKGTVEVEDIFVTRQLVTNGDFVGTLDPWVNDDDGTLTWSHFNGSAYISTSVAGYFRTHTLYQSNGLTGYGPAGSPVRVKVKATIDAVFSKIDVFGVFYDESLVIIKTFSIGTVLSGSVEFNINETVPASASYFGVFVDWTNPGGDASAHLDYAYLDGSTQISLSGGLNKCIGTHENIEKNSMFYWIWNSNGYHGVYRYNANTDAVTQLLVDDPLNPVLDFSNDPRHLITGIGMIGDLLLWTDNRKRQCYINTTRTYTSLNDFKISLLKPGPKTKPTFGLKETDSIDTKTTNMIADNSFQFAFLYVYLDNERSVLSPFSDLLYAEAKGIDMSFVNAGSIAIRNKILVSHVVDSDILSAIKRVELVFRIGNGTEWRVWKKIDNIPETIQEYFYNTMPSETLPTLETTKLFDQIPNRSKALTIFRGRVFLNVDEEGFDLQSISISAALTENIDTITDTRQFIKKQGNYAIGVVEHDTFGRCSTVVTKTFVQGKQLLLDPAYLFLTANPPPSNETTNNTQANRINVFLSGLGLPNGRYSIVMSEDLQYESYMQVPVWPKFYKREKETSSLASDERAYIEKVYWIGGTTSGAPANKFSYIHLLLPNEIPFLPTTDYFVRILNKANNFKIEKVLDVIDGNMLVVGNFGVEDWSLVSNCDDLFVEIFTLKQSQDPFFYEVAGPYNFDASGVIQTPTITDLKSDTYYRGGGTVDDYHKFNFKGGSFWIALETRRYLQIEQPTPIYTKESKVATLVSNPSLSSKQPVDSWTPDYNKRAWSRGRVFVEGEFRKVLRPATIRFSDPYIEGSQVNGLTSFPVGNTYDKIGQDRSPITKIIAVGNVLVAVHERHVTTMYIGEGIVRTGETGFITKVDNVVGDDRKLVGDHGSYHPESLQEIDGKLFGYDIFSGQVWGYTVEGIVAISNYGMANYFKDRSEQYFASKDELQFVSSVDKYHKEYLLTMPPLYAQKQLESLQSLPPLGQFDIVLDPDEYVIGETYRVKLVLFKQTGTPNDRISISAFTDNGAVIENMEHNVTSNVESDSTPAYIEFVYDGVGFIRVFINFIDYPIYCRASVEYQVLKGETWGYHYKSNVWQLRYSYVPDFMGKVGNLLLSFKNGILYKHNMSDTRNNYYGVQHERKVTVAVNPQPNKDKTWSAVQIATQNLCVDPTGTYKVFEATNEHGQSTFARAKEFTKDFQRVYNAPILKDVNTNPLLIPAGRNALRDGKDMHSKSLEVTINNNSTTSALMQKVNIVGEHSEFSV